MIDLHHIKKILSFINYSHFFGILFEHKKNILRLESKQCCLPLYEQLIVLLFRHKGFSGNAD
jgi:hypothetical protein